MIGLGRGIVELSDPDPDWTDLADGYIGSVRRSLGDALLDVQHIGSTSIRGIRAKPIIDLVAIIVPNADMDPVIDGLSSIGFDYRKRELSGKALFAHAPGGERKCLLHLMPEGHPDWERYILFRDRLNADPRQRAEYVTLKESLVVEYHDDPRSYVSGKDDFVSAIIGGRGHHPIPNGIGPAVRSLLEASFAGDAGAMTDLAVSIMTGDVSDTGLPDPEILLWHALSGGDDRAAGMLDAMYDAGDGKYAFLDRGSFHRRVGVLMDDRVESTIDRIALQLR